MTRFVAVAGVVPDEHRGALKRAALLFDAIAVPGATRTVSGRAADAYREFEWLLDQGIVVDVPYAAEHRLPHDPEYQRILTEARASDRKARVFERDALDDASAGLFEAEADALRLRAIAREIATEDDTDAVVLSAGGAGPVPFRPAEGSRVGKDAVVRMVIRQLPIPDDLTPWEDILEFRADPAGREAYLSLKAWINEMARSTLPPGDVADTLLLHLEQYENAMRLHRLKFVPGVLEVVVTTTADALENLVKLNWGKLAKAAFDVRRQRIDLLEAERRAPGCALAYVIRARERFVR
jgi:hypothetical protein